VKGCDEAGDLDLEVREDNKDYYAATIMSVDLSIR
jgi:hypothetical protein